MSVGGGGGLSHSRRRFSATLQRAGFPAFFFVSRSLTAGDCPADLNLPTCSAASLATGDLCLGAGACADASLTNCGRRRLQDADAPSDAVYRVVAPAPAPGPGGGGGSKSGGGGDDAGLIAGVVIAVIVALLGAGGAWYYYSKRQRTKPDAKVELPSWADSNRDEDPPPPPATSPTPSLAFASAPPMTSPKSYEERRAMGTPSARMSADLLGIDRPSFMKMKSQNDGLAPPVALRSEPPAPPSPFWKRLAPLFGVAAADAAAAEEPQPSWSRMTPPGSTEEPSTPVDLAAAAPLPPPLLLNSPPLNEAIQSVIDPPELRPRAGRPLTPPPKREGFGQGPSAAIATSPRDVVMEPEGPRRAARVDPSSPEIDALWPADAENGNS